MNITPFDSSKPIPQLFRPTRDYVQIHYVREGNVGGIIMPNNMRQLDFIVARTIAVGPECKMIKPHQTVIVATKAIVGGEKGLDINGEMVQFTQENLIIAVIEAPMPIADVFTPDPAAP